MNNNLEIVIEYYKNIRKLLNFEENEIIKNIEDVVLKNVLMIYEREDEFDYFSELISVSDCVKVFGDASALNLQIINSDEERLVLESKAEIVKEDKINYLKMFDANVFVKQLREEAISGDIYSVKLLALLECNGLLISKDIKNSLRLYEMLAISRDLFSIKMLVRLYSGLNQLEKYDVWKNVLKIQMNSDLIKLSFNLSDEKEFNKKTLDICMLIDAIQNRKIIKKSLDLEMYMLYYLINSEERIEEKLSNVLNIESDGCFLLIKEEMFKGKKYNF